MEFAADNGFIQIGYVFAAGFVSSLTPCVYPMIPITLSIFGATEEISRMRAFVRSLMYVLGIAFTYTTLGMVTAKTGMVFGSFQGNPYVVGALCIFLLALSLHTLEVFTFQLGKLQSKASKVGGKGAVGALLMGMVSGVVAAPCVGPVLVLVLIEAAKSDNAFWGGALLLSYSLGLGLIFLALGTFSSLLHKLPKSGNWLSGIKYLIAVGVLIAALFLIKSLNLGVVSFLEQLHVVIPLVVCIVTLALTRYAYRFNLRSAAFASASVVALCLFTLLITPNRSEVSEAAELAWIDEPSSAFQMAKKENKPIMLDLYADWCAACKELEANTFSDHRVSQTLSKHLITARMDFTTENDETDSISEKYGVIGLPCVLFLNPNGEEIPGTRITGFMNADKFLEHLDPLARDA